MAGHVGGLAAGERAFCPECFHTLWAGGTCKRRTCPAYAPRYLRDQAERLKAGLAVWEAETTIATLTAPGADVLPWDPTLCKIEGPHRHSGPDGCAVDQWAAAAWNRTVTRRLSSLNHAARERVRRAKLLAPDILASVLETKRGVFHAHVILGYEPCQRQGLELFLDVLDELRGEYEFGTSRGGGFDRGRPGFFTGPHAGLYSSKYLRPDSAKGSFVPVLRKIEELSERDPNTGRMRDQVRPVFVSPKLTRRSGVTMRFLRWARYAFVMWGALPRDEVLAAYRIREVFGQVELESSSPQVKAKPPPAQPLRSPAPVAAGVNVQAISSATRVPAQLTLFVTRASPLGGPRSNGLACADYALERG